MATPTEAELQTQISNLIHIYEELREFGEADPTNLVGMLDTLTQSLETDFAGATLAAVNGTRARLSAALGDAEAALLPLLVEWMKNSNVDKPERDIQGIFDRLYDRFIASGDRVASRVFTFGSPTAGGGNTGDGVLRRLTKDERNFDLEAGHVDAKRAECLQDQNTGAEKHEEVFEILGGAAGPDLLQVSGSGLRSTIRALSARDSLLNNASFSSRSGTDAAPTAITDWTSSSAIVGDGSDYTFDATNFYRGDPSDGGTPKALNIKLTRNVSQKINVRRTRLNAAVPYLLQVAWNREVGAASGTLLARMGAVNNSVSVSAQTGWQLLLVPGTTGQNNWYRQFDEDELDISIEWTRTGGEILIDDVLLVPGTPFDGSWYWMIGGATAFLREDEFTWTDTATESVLQRWFARIANRYLPHATGVSVTWADP